jgi:hypothetical protein
MLLPTFLGSRHRVTPKSFGSIVARVFGNAESVCPIIRQIAGAGIFKSTAKLDL